MGRTTNSVLPMDTGDLEWVIRDENDTALYKIAPYSNHLCYNLYQWSAITDRKTGETRWDWKDTGVYPSTLEHACDIIRNRLVMNSGVKTSDLTELKKAITRSTNLIVGAVRKGFDNVDDKSK